MTLDARPVGPDDGAACGRMLLAASLREVGAWHEGQVPGTAGTLIWEDDEPVGGMMVAPEEVLLHGRPAISMPVLAGGVRMGASYEATLACRQHLGAHWRDGGAAVVFKWGMTRDFFNELFGYFPLMLGWEVTCRFPDPVPPRLPSGVRRATPADVPALAALYARRSQAHSGTVLRSQQAWQDDYYPFFTTAANRALFVHDGPQSIDGYLALRRGGQVDAPVLVVAEWLDDSPAAWRALWAALSHLAGDRMPVTLPPLPPDRPWDALWPEAMTMRPIRSLLFRPGAPEHFWPTVACLPGDGDVTLSVNDPFQLWPAKLRIRWSAGRITGWEPVDRAEVHTDVGTLGAVALGFLDVRQAQRLRKLDGEASALERLASAFRQASLYRYPADFRVHKQRQRH